MFGRRAATISSPRHHMPPTPTANSMDVDVTSSVPPMPSAPSSHQANIARSEGGLRSTARSYRPTTLNLDLLQQGLENRPALPAPTLHPNRTRPQTNDGASNNQESHDEHSQLQLRDLARLADLQNERIGVVTEAFEETWDHCLLPFARGAAKYMALDDHAFLDGVMAAELKGLLSIVTRYVETHDRNVFTDA